MKVPQLIRRSCCLTLMFAVAGLIFETAALTSQSTAAEDKSQLAKFMRKKLVASSEILEGLAVEDAALIKQGAAAILEMSKSELWNVLLDEDYREFNRDFRSSMKKLERAAEEKNLDNALLQWTDAVKGCVECHKYVRTQRAAGKVK